MEKKKFFYKVFANPITKSIIKMLTSSFQIIRLLGEELEGG